MAKMKVTLTKKAAKGFAAATPAKLGAGSPVPVAFNLQDNGDATFTVLGVDAANFPVDISGVATMSVISDNTAVITVDPPTGMNSAIHAPTSPAPAPGTTANVTIVVTWNDGSVGPFTITWPISIIAGPVSGIVVQPGTPTVH